MRLTSKGHDFFSTEVVLFLKLGENEVIRLHIHNNTKEKLYLCDDYYTSPAVMVRENNGAWQLYYIGRDYLGSITNVVSESGNESYEYSYDAWGNLRNPDTQALYAQDEQPDLFLGRGFTGHEHLPFCNLINMNARLYDPVAGRFLSPDPYVQSSDFTQSYNRYSYAWNNPLRYADPTGEKSYTWDPDLRQYRDDDGLLADWSEVYKAAFDCGLFRPGGSMFADGTSYGTGYGSFPYNIVGGENGAKAGYTYFFVAVREKAKGETYTGNDGNIYTYDSDAMGVLGILIPNMDAWLKQYGNLNTPLSMYRINDPPLECVHLDFDLALICIGFIDLLTKASVDVGAAALDQAAVKEGTNTVTRSESVLGHIFKDDIGHVNPSTAASQNRYINLFESVGNNPDNLNPNVLSNFQRAAGGFQGYSQTFRNGQQVWIQTLNGKIFDAGVNIIPK